MELVLRNRQFELPAEISNLEELRQCLAPKLEFYKSLVVTEDSIKSAKSDKADLNKLKKAIDEKRKDIKKAYLEPYKKIEGECQAITDMIDEPVKAIDSQIKAIEAIETEKKKAVLEESFNAENTFDFVRFEDVINEKWANKTEKTEKLIAEMKLKISGLKADFDYLQNMYSGSPLWTAILYKFMETKSKENTLAYAVELERLESQINSSVTACNENSIIAPVQSQNAVDGNSDGDKTISGTFKVTCTKSQLIALRDFMKENGISFEVVK